MTLTEVLRTAQKFATDNSPGILTGLGVAGLITTALLTGRAAFRVGLDANAGHYEPIMAGLEPESLETKDLAKRYWKEYVPPAIVGAASIACIIGANHIGARRSASLAAAFKISEQMATEYKAKVVDTLGKKAEEKMQAELAAERMERTPGREAIIIDGSQSIFFDAFSGRYFSCEMQKVRKAVNDINFQVNNNFYASLTDFYDLLGLDRTDVSDEFGWNADEQLEPSYHAVMMPNDQAAIQITFNKSPIRGYDRVQ